MKKIDPDQTPAAPAGATATEPAAPESAAPDAGEASDELGLLRREIQELRDKNLRLVADQRNLQQRLTRDKEEALRYAESDFAKELLVVIDDLDRTQESVRSGADAKVLADGVRIIQEHFEKVLRSRGVERITAEGRPFDPGLHEALMQQPSADVPAGTVLKELAPGYRMHDRVLRPARVIVSSGA
jgi:molecular chaperone GrpE